MKNILFLVVLLPLLLLNACHQPIFGTFLKKPELTPLLTSAPLLANQYFAIHQVSPRESAQDILAEVTTLSHAIRKWLNIATPKKNVKVLIFSSTDPAGKYYLQRSRTRHQSTGSYNRKHRILLVTGSTRSPRFLTVLRHEAAHAALLNGLPVSTTIPFWLNEGIASFFEQGDKNLLKPKQDNERLKLLRYLLAEGEPLNFKELISNPMPKKIEGALYARSWGLVSCLYYHQHPIKDYFNKLAIIDIASVQHFQQYLLKPQQSIAEFELVCKNWLLELS